MLTLIKNEIFLTKLQKTMIYTTLIGNHPVPMLEVASVASGSGGTLVLICILGFIAAHAFGQGHGDLGADLRDFPVLSERILPVY